MRNLHNHDQYEITYKVVNLLYKDQSIRNIIHGQEKNTWVNCVDKTNPR